MIDQRIVITAPTGDKPARIFGRAAFPARGFEMPTTKRFVARVVGENPRKTVWFYRTEPIQLPSDFLPYVPALVEHDGELYKVPVDIVDNVTLLTGVWTHTGPALYGASGRGALLARGIDNILTELVSNPDAFDFSGVPVIKSKNFIAVYGAVYHDVAVFPLERDAFGCKLWAEVHDDWRAERGYGLEHLIYACGKCLVSVKGSKTYYATAIVEAPHVRTDV